MQSGLILFAHGARDARWAAPFTAIAQQVQVLRPELQVRLAFLELMEPSLAAAADELVLAGCQRIHVQPLFLGTGGHLRRDLPLLMAALSARHPAVDLKLQTAVGEMKSVQTAIALASVENLE